MGLFCLFWSRMCSRSAIFVVCRSCMLSSLLYVRAVRVIVSFNLLWVIVYKGILFKMFFSYYFETFFFVFFFTEGIACSSKFLPICIYLGFWNVNFSFLYCCLCVEITSITVLCFWFVIGLFMLFFCFVFIFPWFVFISFLSPLFRIDF